MDEVNESSLEKRVALLEASLLTLTARMSNVESALATTSNVQTVVPDPVPRPEHKPSPISVTLARKTFHEADFRAGDAGNRIDFIFQFHSHLDKDVRAFKGAVIIKDLFDADILKVNLLCETGLPAGGTAVWKGGIQHNQFIATHQRLRTVEQKDMAVSFTCDSLIYLDGTRETLA